MSVEVVSVMLNYHRLPASRLHQFLDPTFWKLEIGSETTLGVA